MGHMLVRPDDHQRSGLAVDAALIEDVSASCARFLEIRAERLLVVDEA